MKKILKIVLISFVSLIAILFIAAQIFLYKVKYGFPIYESKPPELPLEMAEFSILNFNKTNGFRHGAAIEASTLAFEHMADENGWSLFSTDNGAIFNEAQLNQFDVIIWNNVTGRVLKDEQQLALKKYMDNGGGFIGIHGSGDNSHHWEWYEENLIGAKFSHHSISPQFQEATLHLECNAEATFPCHSLATSILRSDEWYVFYDNPRDRGYEVLYTLDEKMINTNGNIRFLASDKDFGMGDDHPIVWYKELPSGGRTLYSALGHGGDAFKEPQHLDILRQGILWVGKL